MPNMVQFEDYSIQVKNAIHQNCLIFLKEATEEILSMTVRNSVRDTGQTAGSFTTSIDPSGMVGYVGSNFDNAIWEEFGTGEFAEKGDGRKGWWVYVKGSSKRSTGSKVYPTQGQAKKAVAMLRKKGLDAYYTRGKHARHPFRDAYNGSKNRIIRRATQIFGGMK